MASLSQAAIVDDRLGRGERRGAADRSRSSLAFAAVRLTQKRSSFLGFEPPAVGEDEFAAVAETSRSAWLTTGAVRDAVAAIESVPARFT